MMPPWAYLDDQDRATFRATVAFLNKRLADAATVDWALGLKSVQRIERLAIEDLLNSPDGLVLPEPWATTWRLIEESWSTPEIEEGPSTAIYGIQKRLRTGDHSGAIISGIVDLVAPRLKVEPIDSWRWQFIKKPAHPKTFEHLLSANLTSGHLIDVALLELSGVTDMNFLKALGMALESNVNHGLEVARRLGWDGQHRLWQLGGLGRVYYVSARPRAHAREDPDAFNRGIAPSVKLLYTVVERIAELNGAEALAFVQRWRLAESPIYIRLWAAAARDDRLVAPADVGQFLTGLDNRHFWNLHEFPEIAELRATRFSELDARVQTAIARRVSKGPPRNLWPRTAEPEKISDAQLYWTIRELKRIEVAGAILPEDERSLLEANVDHFTDLAEINVDNGFPEASEAYAVPPRPDAKYETLSGLARLRSLEAALSTGRGGWDDDPAERANDWLQQSENPLLVLSDLEATEHGGDEFPRLWHRFGWAHSPRGPDAPERDLQTEADRVLALLNQLSDSTLSAAIEGISAWLDMWAKQVVAAAQGSKVWLRVWPIAIEATNSRSDNSDDADLRVAAHIQDDGESMDLDTLNTPAGKLVGVFLAACPSLNEVPHPFAASDDLRRLRGTVISAPGSSGLLARHRLIEALPYFLRADRSWTEQHLVAPLLNTDSDSLALWRAIARRTHFTEVLKIIGDTMAERATDRRLSRETRRKLVFSLVIESLHAFRESREPAVPNARIQQMLRGLDDEVRADAANAVQQFVRELSTDKSSDSKKPSPTAAELFRSAAAPFLQQVWPQERSLATPGVSSAFADLPAASGEAFVEAVDSIERFLVPFECWSMIDYGLHDDAADRAKEFAVINSGAKAEALLRLLDLTVGSAEGSVVPHDLAGALDQIRSVDPELAKNPIYRRLSAAARR